MSEYVQVRTHQRTDLIINAEVSEDLKNWYAVKSNNISSGGINFSSDKVFNPGTIVTLQISVHCIARELKLHVKARILQNVHNYEETERVYRAEFTNISSKDGTDLDELIQYSENAIDRHITTIDDDGSLDRNLSAAFAKVLKK